MSQKIYLDTNVYLDYYLDRKDCMRPLGEFAWLLYNEAVSCKFVVLISPDVIRELRNVLSINEQDIWSKILKGLKNANKIIEIHSDNELDSKAKNLSRKQNIPIIDSLHLILAAENQAILVTRDSHFENLKELFAIKKPEELIRM